MKFSDLKLSDPILRSLQDQNYKEPTPIQADVIPAILNKSDVMAAAQTGTGKTAAFVLPILSILSNPKNNYKGHQLRALIVTPTRELAAQVRESVNTYSKYLSIRSTAVYGGARIHNQQLKLRKGVDVLVATPGRAATPSPCCMRPPIPHQTAFKSRPSRKLNGTPHPHQRAMIQVWECSPF